MRKLSRTNIHAASLVLVAVAATPARGQSADRFVAAAGAAGLPTLGVRPRAAVAGIEVRLRDVCRWNDADAATFAPLADLSVIRLGDGGSSADVTVDGLRATLREAGVNLAAVRLTGAATCACTRDLTLAAASPAASAPAPRPSAAEAECNPFHTLRDRLAADAADRLNVPPADLQLTFAAADANLLNLAEPTFAFTVEPRHVTALGKVTWDVTVISGGATQHAAVSADARAWQDQLVLTANAAYHAVLRPADVEHRRVLVTHLSDDAPLTPKQAVGQQAARDLKAGTVLTAKVVDPVPMARVGQYVTVTVRSGGVVVRTTAKAMEAGSYGQAIKVRNEATRDEYSVTLTGPQAASMGQDDVDANLASIRE